MVRAILRGLTVAAAGCLAGLALPQTARGDDVMWLDWWQTWFTLLTLVLVVEPMVVVYEARYLWRVLKVPVRAAYKWSLLANLASFVVGGVVVYLWGGLMMYAGSNSLAGFIAVNMGLLAAPVLILVSIGLAVALEYPVLRRLNTHLGAEIPLAKHCWRMNAISVPLAYALQGLCSLIPGLVVSRMGG